MSNKAKVNVELEALLLRLTENCMSLLPLALLHIPAGWCTCSHGKVASVSSIFPTLRSSLIALLTFCHFYNLLNNQMTSVEMSHFVYIQFGQRSLFAHKILPYCHIIQHAVLFYAEFFAACMRDDIIYTSINTHWLSLAIYYCANFRPLIVIVFNQMNSYVFVVCYHKKLRVLSTEYVIQW